MRESVGPDIGVKASGGIRDAAAVDAMIEAMLTARGRAEFVDAVRALDRLLMSGTYVVPLCNLPRDGVARWERIKRPERVSVRGYELDSWWDGASR